MQSDLTYYELQRRLVERRSQGSDYAYEVHRAATVVARGTTYGRMLRKPGRFETSEGEFTIAPTSKLANRWQAVWSTGRPIADFDLANLGRGRTAITDLDRLIDFRFSSVDGAISDAVKAMVLLHTGAFQLTGPGGELLAVTGMPHAAAGLLAAVRSLARLATNRSRDYASVEGLTLVDSDWTPSPVLITSILVFKNQVVDPVRSP